MRISIESPRGCGHRSPGGLYLVTKGGAFHCGRLPIPLTTCPTCSTGVKFTRGFTWITPADLFAGRECDDKSCGEQPRDGVTTVAIGPSFSLSCPMSVGGFAMIGRHGLLWIGEKYYSPEAFKLEARTRGVSRRIVSVPKDLKLGETWIYCAHRKGAPCPDCGVEGDTFELLPDPDNECERCEGTGAVRAIFYAFKPDGIERIATGNETDEEIERDLKRGIVQVRVARVDYDGTPLTETDEMLKAEAEGESCES